ncbi:type II toxin-antitoxin system toxin DNA ADP-ribosyl transferase DarT [Phycisphaera mikurensis]|uniref:type II toxin-antitoxin system toxin DNA ADP-ribosyl transferase DarT n=1 Tax=Phycisphaera mikurensis TaxID=547188 RepID=UPI0018EE83E5|nr:DUF4433 domain-containing protein [Phycisphaera mikurensis]
MTHRDNLPWILEHGLHCPTSDTLDPGFVAIGREEIIDRRTRHEVSCGPGGVLADYVPFYFTPRSIMAFNIRTGFHGLTQRDNDDLVVLVSSIPRLLEMSIGFVFYSGQAMLHESTCHADAADLTKIDWALLNAADFRNDPEDPGKKGRYQAEALVHRHTPVEALLGVGCYSPKVAHEVDLLVQRSGRDLAVKPAPKLFFR